jgi:hypothetical protein
MCQGIARLGWKQELRLSEERSGNMENNIWSRNLGGSTGPLLDWEHIRTMICFVTEVESDTQREHILDGNGVS